ncbi:SURP and G-patch domain-containing protein 1-like protein isoform X4 [Phragmites australis]|uniref:SURP and G-patch domain-containing protein 1-like protein isoform X4 n=1 Tax=Phragmites australis TaxID=29695 RepID=UPI002D77C098|nr:SURP and G-patch domain-containing protein 1-like protein isoform X4 [Phragmites australis]
MDKGLFANDGSFLERFKQMQQEMKEKEKAAAAAASSAAPKPVNPKQGVAVAANKRPFELKAGPVGSGGKLAFSLKKAKVTVTPVFAADDEDEDAADVEKEEPAKRQKSVQAGALVAAAPTGAVAPTPPNDMTVRQVADKLASFVAKNGRQFENITRQRNPGDTPFKFLFDKHCSDYKYYEFWLAEEERVLAQSKEAEAPKNGDPNMSAPSDPVALMEFYMKKAAQEERKRPPRQSKDEMPPPPSLQGPPKKGHHMGDFIPPEELEKFMSRCNDAAAQKATKEAAEKAKIQADNIGHKLLSKMGWREGEGLGSERRGRADPIMAGDVKKDHLGVGAVQPGEVSAEDDIYEQYKKRMMLGYRYRPNPLNNPRKQYY